jgi:hypothetical protein
MLIGLDAGGGKELAVVETVCKSISTSSICGP